MGGHHPSFNAFICKAFIDRGHEALIYGAKTFPNPELEGIPVKRIFRETSYSRINDNPLSGPYQTFQRNTQSIFEDLHQLDRSDFRSTDLILFPTVTEISMMGLVQWVNSFGYGQTPTFAMYLMMENGVDASKMEQEGTYEVENPIKAQFYRLAFEENQKKGPFIYFFGTGKIHAKQYAALSEQEIESHPILTSGISALQPPQKDSKTPLKVTLYVGEIKEPKGFYILPEVVEQLAQKYPEISFFAQGKKSQSSPRNLAALEKLQELNAALENFQLLEGYVDDDTYLDILLTSDIIPCPYDIAFYRTKSSGILWEGVGTQTIMVVPQDSWLDAELAYWEGIGSRFAQLEAASITTAVEQAITLAGDENIKLLIAKASRGFLAENNEEVLFKQLEKIWSENQQNPKYLPQEAFRLHLHKDLGKGWLPYDFDNWTRIRWTEKRFSLDLNLPPSPKGWICRMKGRSNSMNLDKIKIRSKGRKISVNEQATHLSNHGRWTLQFPIDPQLISGKHPLHIEFNLPTSFNPLKRPGLCVEEILLRPA